MDVNKSDVYRRFLSGTTDSNAKYDKILNCVSVKKQNFNSLVFVFSTRNRKINHERWLILIINLIFFFHLNRT